MSSRWSGAGVNIMKLKHFPEFPGAPLFPAIMFIPA
jgi:hypothetical protein